MSYEEAGMTRVTMRSSLTHDATADERLLSAVQETLRGQFDLHGVLGRSDDDSIVYLATEIASKRLVALRIAKDAQSADGDYWVEVVRRLDASVPALESSCPACGGKLRGWARFCRHCGADLSGVAQGSGPNTSADDLLREVRAASRGSYDILGPMDRAEGGGIVYFAKEVPSGRLVALRLTRQAPSEGGTEVFQLGVTTVLSDFKRSLGVDGLGLTTPGAILPTLPPPEPSGGSRSAPPPVASPTPVAPVAPLPVAGVAPPSAATDDRRRGIPVSWVVSGGIAAAALAFWLWARAASAPASSANQPPVAAVQHVDSGEIRLGATLPPGSTVRVDDVPLAGSQVRLPVGRHVVAASAAGFQDVRQELNVGVGEVLVWTPQLVRAVAVASVGQGSAGSPRPPSSSGASGAPPAATKRPPRSAVTDSAATLSRTPSPAPRTVRASCTSLVAQQDWPQAMTKCDEEAQGGSASAQTALGRMYENGRGTAANAGTAADWYRKAAEAGDAEGQFHLGLALMNGDGVKKDERSGIEWLRKAVDQEQPDAMYALARSLERGRGVKRDMSGAVQMFQRAADLGNVLSEHKLGELYSDGNGVSRNETTAAEWFQKSAIAGFADSEYRLGQMYADGRGVARSTEEAKRWLGAAAAKGHKDARAALARLK